MAQEQGSQVMAVNLPQFQGILSHFTQPGKMFADELSDRLKVIACIEKPNMAHSEESELKARGGRCGQSLDKSLDAQDRDAQLLIWGPEADIPTALETIEERCRLAFEGVPRESRKSLENGTTLFERVLPGPNRMYPDTDSVPIPLEMPISRRSGSAALDVRAMIDQMRKWGIPADTYAYILRKNLFPLIRRMAADLRIAPAFLGTLFGHKLKHVEGQFARSPDFLYECISDLLSSLQTQRIDLAIAGELLPELYQHPQMDPLSVLTSVNFKRIPESQVLDAIPFLKKIADQSDVTVVPEARVRWIMGQLRPMALGNLGMPELTKRVTEAVLGEQKVPSNKAGAHE